MSDEELDRIITDSELRLNPKLRTMPPWPSTTAEAEDESSTDDIFRLLAAAKDLRRRRDMRVLDPETWRTA